MELNLAGEVAVVTGASKHNIGAVRPRLDGFLAITDAEWQWALDVVPARCVS